MTKYRGIRKDNGEWVEGNLVNNLWGYFIIQHFGIQNEIIVSSIASQVIPESISLFTTLTDKTGKEIFGSIPVNGVMSRGGDVLKFNYDNFVQIEKPIEWSGNGFWVKGENDSNFLPAMSGTEIIGNQYDSEMKGDTK